MANIYAAFSDEAQTTIVSISPCAQPTSTWQYQAVIDTTTSAPYATFIAGLPKAVAGLWPTPGQ